MFRFLRRTRRRSRGQGLVEFALVLPVLLLIVFTAIDFGRIYLGWINLQNMVRLAANYAANHASDLNAPVVPATQAEYRNLVAAEAQKINCHLPPTIPDPQFPDGADLGDRAFVAISCQFDVLTPLIDRIVGKQVLVSASTTFPVKQGAVTSVTGGGGVVTPPAQAIFYASPNTGNASLVVNVVNESTNGPTSWVWSFGDGATSLQANPPAHSYPTAGTYTITLTASNAGGNTTASQTVTVGTAPTTGPIPNFSATPRLGGPPLVVKFTDLSTGSPTSWNWSFGDGQSSTAQNPTHTYANPGVYTVALTVTNLSGSNTETREQYVIAQCTVPNLGGTKKNSAQSTWSAAGFTTTVTFLAGTGNYTIRYQSLPGGLINPAGGCAASITVGP
jgi:PKD repeat protein